MHAYQPSPYLVRFINTLTNSNIMTYYKTIATAVFFFLLSSCINAQTYTTMAPGTWLNTTNVWSTNGGATPCGCTPGANPGAVTINVAHPIAVTPNMSFIGTTMTVMGGGSLNGAFDLNANNSTLDIYGPVTLSSYTQSGSTNASIYFGGSLLATNQIVISGGTLNVDQAILTSGSVNILIGATINLLNGSKWNINTGNLRNRGTINLDPDTCIETNGNIQNQATGAINGSGALNSGGNINNAGSISPTISWCANGAGVGMTTPEDCTTATGICNAIVLPIELESFTAEINEYEEVELNWVTLSELNSSHFIVSKSADGENWKEILTVTAAGTTTETTHYFGLDEASYGITYYLLTQYDNDGRKNVFGPVSVSMKNNKITWSAYPNPVNGNGKIILKDLSTGFGELSLSNAQGTEVDAMLFNTGNGQLEFPLNNLESGIYLLTVAVGDETKTERIVVTE